MCIPKTKYEDKSTEIKMSSEILEKHSLAQLLATDEITLIILPQKKGFFRKHVEYEIKSSKHKSQVCILLYKFKIECLFISLKID